MKDEILKKAKEGNEFVFSDYSYLTLTESDIHDICCALKQNQNLRTLDVSKSLRLEIFSSIYAKKIIFIFDEICRILEENRNINSLVLSNNSLGYHFPQENVVQLLSIIKGRENIISLDLSNNEFFAGPYPTIIFGLIDSHKNLQQLFLRGNRLFDIGSEYFKVLSWALLNNKRLLELDLRNNTQEGYQNRYNLKVLLEMICIHPCITYIDLRGNDFEKYLGFILLGTLNNLFTRTQLREIKFDSEKINKQDIILGDLLEKSGMKDLISGKKDAW